MNIANAYARVATGESRFLTAEEISQAVLNSSQDALNVSLRNGGADVSNTNPLPVAGAPGTYVDASKAITAADVSEQVFAAAAARRYLFIQNISDTDMWVNFGVAAVKDQPSIKISAGGFYEPLVPPAAAVNIICATIAKKYVAKQA